MSSAGTGRLLSTVGGLLPVLRRCGLLLGGAGALGASLFLGRGRRLGRRRHGGQARGFAGLECGLLLDRLLLSRSGSGRLGLGLLRERRLLLLLGGLLLLSSA